MFANGHNKTVRSQKNESHIKDSEINLYPNFYTKNSTTLTSWDLGGGAAGRVQKPEIMKTRARAILWAISVNYMGK